MAGAFFLARSFSVCGTLAAQAMEDEMQCNLLLTAALLAAGIVALPAQQSDSGAPPLYHNTYTHLGLVFVTPVAGAPFSATVLIENQRSLPEGTVETLHTINLIGRDSQG